MKKVLVFLIYSFLIVAHGASAQEVDQEKLLEFYQTQKFAEAANYLKSVYPQELNDIKALSQIAYCNMMAGNLAVAEKNYLKINELSAKQLPVLFNLANINARRGNTKNAVVYLQEIVSIDSNNFNVFKQLANYTDSVSQKIVYLQKANKINSGEADVAYDLALNYRKLKNHKDAYTVLKIAIAADTGNFILQQALLPVANQLSKYTEVVTIGERLLRNSADANVLLDVAKAHFFLKNYQKAIQLYKMLEKTSMQNEASLYYTSLCYREMGNYTMAAIYAQRTINESISPNITAYYSLLAGIYEGKKQFTLAASAYQKGLSYHSSKNIYYRLGLLYDLNLKKPQSALKYYNLYLKSKDLDDSDKPQIDYVKTRLLPIKNN